MPTSRPRGSHAWPFKHATDDDGTSTEGKPAAHRISILPPLPAVFELLGQYACPQSWMLGFGVILWGFCGVGWRPQLERRRHCAVGDGDVGNCGEQGEPRVEPCPNSSEW